MQSLPLEAKIRMTKARIKVWYESWMRFEIYNKKTGKTRFVTMDVRDQFAEPELKDNEFVKSAIDGQVYVGFSGGKDSTVLKHIVDSMYDDVPALFVNTGLEYPEIQQFVRQIKNGEFDCFNSDVEIVRPEMRFDEVIKKYGYPVISKDISSCVHWARRGSPTRLARIKGTHTKKDGSPSMFNCNKWEFMLDAPFEVDNQCCRIMKKNPSKKFEKETGRKPLLGLLANESLKRKDAWMKTGCNAFDLKHPQSQPMAFWTEEDILEYIRQYNVPYCPVYGDIISTDEGLKTSGCSRTGCIFCGFGCHLEKGENRFQKLKKTHPRQYEYCINGGEMADGKWQPSKEGLGLGKVLDYIGVKYE
jgi:3'-phosphoadenosine 5'-phosphosulfate sulfotransferase (PAPS reductase)/FAD synthetase